MYTDFGAVFFMHISKIFFAALLFLPCALLFAVVFEFARLNEISEQLENMRSQQESHQAKTPKELPKNPANDPRMEELYDWYFSLSTELEILKSQVDSLRQAPENYASNAGTAGEPGQSPAQLLPPEVGALEKKIFEIEHVVSKMEQGPSYLSPSDRIALKAEVENIIKSKEKEEDDQRYTQLKTRVFDSLAASLELTDTQKEQVTKIIEQRFQDTAKIRESMTDGNASRQDVQQLWDDVAARTDEEMARILDAQQMEKFTQWKSERPWWAAGRQQGRQQGR